MTPNRKPYICPVLLALVLLTVLMILAACAGPHPVVPWRHRP